MELRRIIGGFGLALLALVTGCANALTDAATRLSAQICAESELLRSSQDSVRTFEHRPLARPEGVGGDYRIEFVHRAGEPEGRRVLLVGDAGAGSLRYHTTSHMNCVQVERDFRAPHAAGEVTLITLEKRGTEVWITDVR